ncbi:MAG: uracil-DNA glycosylase [Tumebacillaceae bacterium]
MTTIATMEQLQAGIVGCTQCPRLRTWCEEVAETKVKRYREQEYWGKPVPGFGDPNARLIILGLAPGAHGANRTGRVFTGDESGVWLYGALHKFGFATQPEATHRMDGLVLHDAYINNVVRCAPPDNKPNAEEIQTCQGHLIEEFQLLTQKKVVLVLGKIAFDNYLKLLKREGKAVKGLTFAHGACYTFDDSSPALLASYHPSQQNTRTGKLTQEMWEGIFARAKELLG